MLVASAIGFAALMSLSQARVFEARQSCSEDFNICSPPGAITGTLGPIDAGWGRLYQDVINVVNGYTIDDAPSTTATVDPSGPARRQLGLCCSVSATCLLIKDYGIPMCWDRFTTNVYFPDGTYGSVVSGDFNTSKGDSINLVYGDYTLKDGSKGNIFSNDALSSVKPNLATMSMPRVWTSSGVGSAIPATELGASASLSIGTTVIPATTIPASTGGSITMIATMSGCANCPPYGTTIPGETQAESTRPASTSLFTTGILAPTSFGDDNSAGSHSATRFITIFALVVTVVSYFHC